ncbi:hypothetical protein EST38_g4409 [Candolleomyces aberdarensis]|uniref:Uncharacterized protein n=1 Tax=Candolleomyces aberdarensis TaxID=2316362 RepID=A0A4Q2DR14_9AGAR|nr:hypothetical protein EST38_g4409 [Candolleomyces aberdarensis]
MSTETTSSSQAYSDALKVLERYKTEGVTREESDEFLQAAIDELDNDTDNKYAENVAQRWITHLNLSRDVASEHVAILKRFDQVYIDMVLSIQTEQDRNDVILELEYFINEDHDRSTEMSQGFLTLKRDIDDFVVRFDAYIETTSAELEQQAVELQQVIEQLKTAIQSLDEQIVDAAVALLASAAAAETIVGLIGLAVAGTILLVLIGQRVAKTIELSDRQNELEDVNKKQEGLAKVKTEFDGLRPDIFLICDKLVLFGEIWSSVRNQSVQFRESLKGGMDATTNIRFRKELELARKLCTPLANGLEKYATQLVNRPSRSA